MSIVIVYGSQNIGKSRRGDQLMKHYDRYLGGKVNSSTQRELVDKITRELADQGKLIELGWQLLRIMTVPADAPQAQLDEMRMAFFAGAQHLYGSIMTMLEPGEDPTKADLSRMQQIDAELEEFKKQLELRTADHKGTA